MPQPGSQEPLEPDSADVSEGVSLSEALIAADQLDPADPDWIDLQWFVADRLHDRYLEAGVQSDLDAAIRRGQLVVEAQGGVSAAHLHDLAVMLWDRVEPGIVTDDLDEYVRLLQAALDLLTQDPVDVELLAKCQANLATGLMSRSRYESADADRRRAVDLWEGAFASEALDDDVRAGVAGNIAQALARPGATEEELREAVRYGRFASASPTDDREVTAQNEFSLAAALASLHNMVDDEGLLEEAVGLVRAGLALLGASHADAPGYTANLVALLRQLARETGDQGVLDEAVTLSRDAIKRTSDADLDRVLILTNAGAAISEAAVQQDDPQLLQEALNCYRRAIDLSAEGSAEQGVALINMTATCRDANERLDAPHLIDEAIKAARRALTIFGPPDLHRAAALTALSNSLRDRFIMGGDLSDLDEALAQSEEALLLTPEQHSEWAARLTNLAVLLSDDYTERADRRHLDRAISLYRDALSADERVAVRIPERLNDLSLALRDRHKEGAIRDDLDEAIAAGTQALDETRQGTLQRAGYASNLGNALAERYDLGGDPNDLDRAIELFTEASTDAAGRVFEASGYLTNLGLALATRARTSGALPDADQALIYLARSVDLLPPAHPDRAHRLSNLADVYRQRSIMLDAAGQVSLAALDAEAAVTTAEDAVQFAASSDARLLPALSNLAEALRWKRELIPGSVEAEEILGVQRRAALLEHITPAEKFGQSGRWAQDAAAAGNPDEALEAYGRAVGLTTEVAWIGLSVSERLRLLEEMGEVLSRAVAFAARNDRAWDALAWADQVRSVLWRQGLQARAVGLRVGNPLLSQALGWDATEDSAAPLSSLREGRRRVAHREHDALQEAIPAPSDYRRLQAPGVVVLLVPDAEVSVALIMRPAQAPYLVELPGASRAELVDHVEALREASSGFSYTGADALMDELAARHRVFDCLDWLWEAVAAPVLGEIVKDPRQRPHVWWSPVGEFALLPVHASGRHPRRAAQVARRNGEPHTVHDLVESSYLPTIANQRPKRTTAQPGTDELLYVSTDAEAGDLDHLSAEREAVVDTLRRIRVTELVNEGATVAALRAELPSCRYLHVAGHSATGSDSLKAGFRLTDGIFTLRDLADCDVRDGALAVLLTCNSATGDAQSPNEALHAAGAAHQAGFPDVVAAVLPVRDSSTVELVRGLYEALDGATGATAAVVPMALYATVNKLRLDPATGPDPLAWVPYAHFSAGFPSLE